MGDVPGGQPLTLCVLGPLQVTGGGRPVAFAYDKVRALLAYLAVEADRPHTRDFLAELLWPNRPASAARHSLSQALGSLRRSLAGCLPAAPLLTPTHTTVQLNPAAGVWLDSREFMAGMQGCDEHAPPQPATCAACTAQLERAAALYRGDFLDQFSIGDSPAFEQWLLQKREALRLSACSALRELAAGYEAQGLAAQALEKAQRLIEIDPWDEAGYRRLMGLRARAGQRSAALALYEQLRRRLAEDLGVEPEQETTNLLAAIRAGELGQPAETDPAASREAAASAAPPFPPVVQSGEAEQRASVFVGRASELAWLGQQLARAAASEGRVVFVLGEAGRGKTALLAEFARRALAVDEAALVLSGSCNAMGGVGDAYLPFRDVLGTLAGQGAATATSALPQPGAARLAACWPAVVAALLEHGPDLPGTLISAAALAQRVEHDPSAPWAPALSALLARRQQSAAADLSQQQLLDQYAQVLRAVSAQHPLMVVLDDLQWADSASIALLFHLGRRLAGSRLLIVGAYRPSEVALPAGEQVPPALASVIGELKRQFGEIQIDLSGQTAEHDRTFVEALVDAQPNRLGPAFRAALLRRTNGNALFTLELLNELRASGGLRRDVDGVWVEGAALHWEALPARVEAVIEGRLGRLYPAMRQALAAASVEGESFTAQVLARVQGDEELAVLRQLDWLARQQRLIQEQDESVVGGQRLARYRFSHALFEDYLYRQLGAGERRALHRKVAEALEALYAERPSLVVAQLAHHYSAAGDTPKAFAYLSAAGDQARQMAATDEAVRRYRAALAAWPEADPGQQADVQRKLGECLLLTSDYPAALAAYGAAGSLLARVGDRAQAGAIERHIGRVHWEQGQRARALLHYHRSLAILEGGAESVELARTVSAISQMHMLASDFEASIVQGERALALARRLEAPDVVMHSLTSLGVSHSYIGRPEMGLRLLQESLALALDAGRVHDALRAFTGAGETLNLVLCRYDEARALLEEMLAYARSAHATMFTGVALYNLTLADWSTGRWTEALERAAHLRDWMHRHEASVATVWGSMLLGRIENDLGRPEVARPILEGELARARSMDELQATTPYLNELARAWHAAGQDGEAGAFLKEALAQIERTPQYEPNAQAALLFACQWYAAQGTPKALGAAEKCLAWLRQASEGQGRPAARAAWHEAQGSVALAQGEADVAAEQLQRAAKQWAAISHPYDELRAQAQLGQARQALGDVAGAATAQAAARALAQTLAEQLPDDGRREAFLRSIAI